MSEEEKKQRKNHYRNYFKQYKNNIKKQRQQKPKDNRPLKFSFGVNMINSENKLKFLSSDGSKTIL